MNHPSELAREIQGLRAQLHRYFHDGDWGDLANCLRSVAALAEAQSSLMLCLRAQSIRELLGDRQAGGRGAEAGPRLTELFTELQFHLTHLEWNCQVREADAPWGEGWVVDPSNSELESSATLV